MKSNRQRRTEIKAKRAKNQFVKTIKGVAGKPIPVGKFLVSPDGSYPDFAPTGFYIDVPFVCRDCKSKEIWTANQQKWWFETAKGNWYGRAIRCRECRQKHRELVKSQQAPKNSTQASALGPNYSFKRERHRNGRINAT